MKHFGRIQDTVYYRMALLHPSAHWYYIGDREVHTRTVDEEVIWVDKQGSCYYRTHNSEDARDYYNHQEGEDFPHIRSVINHPGALMSLRPYLSPGSSGDETQLIVLPNQCIYAVTGHKVETYETAPLKFRESQNGAKVFISGINTSRCGPNAKIEVIKIVRTLTGHSLSECKELVENLQERGKWILVKTGMSVGREADYYMWSLREEDFVEKVFLTVA